VAGEFVRLSYTGREPDPLTRLRLQKLLYYAQGWSFVVRGANLFPDVIQARRFGPSVRSVESALPRDITDGVIGKKQLAGQHPLSEEVAAFVRAVWEAYRGYSASSLSQMAQEDGPWRETWGERTPDAAGAETIAPVAIADYFARQPVPGPISEHRNYRLEQERRAREEMAAMPPLDIEKFRALAPRAKPRTAGKR
jgi:uncharacterized phage-associated protein